MNTAILLISIIVSIISLFISFQTLKETRNKYYDEYLKRKQNKNESKKS
jgi:hypothetical protein